MKQRTTLNINSLLVTAGFTVLWWCARTWVVSINDNTNKMHDDVLIIKTDMVHRQEFDIQMTQIKADQAAIKADQVDLRLRLTGFELELQKSKKPN